MKQSNLTAHWKYDINIFRISRFELLLNMRILFNKRYGLCECCDSLGDALLAYCCGSCYTALASDKTGKGLCYSFLQCLFFPLGVCCLRNHARKKHNIEVKHFYTH